MFPSHDLYVSRSIEASSVFVPGIPSGSKVDPNLLSNYFRQNFASGSGAGGNTRQGYGVYEDYSQPFLIEVGDEIRVTHNISSNNLAEVFVTQDFTVTEVGSREDLGFGSGDCDTIAWVSPTANEILNSRCFDRVKVSPDPSTLEQPITDGEIYNFTIRRRVNADDRVIIFQTPPKNVEGAATPSPSGYLVPADMTPIQKRNVRSLITQLNAKNAFPSDAADQEPIRGEGF